MLHSGQNNQISFINAKTSYFKHSFFSTVIAKWNSLYVNIPYFTSCNILNSSILTFIRLKSSKIFDMRNTEELKLLKRMHLGLSHLSDQKFRQNFQNCLESIDTCGQQIETTTHFLSSLPNIFFEKINCINSNILLHNEVSITKDLLFSSDN